MALKTLPLNAPDCGKRGFPALGGENFLGHAQQKPSYFSWLLK
jgi:hypothetical protein